MDSKRSSIKVFSATPEKLLTERMTVLITLACKSKSWYFQTRNQLYLFSQLSQNISCIFFHQYITGYTLNPFYRNTTKKQTLPPGKTHNHLNSSCLWGKEQHGWRTEERLFTEYPFTPFELYTMWMYYLLLKTCLTKLFQVSDISGFYKPESILAAKKCGVHVNSTSR